MSARHSNWLPILLLIVISAAVFFTGINWGLPSRAVDRFLFPSMRPWSGAEIDRLGGGWPDDPQRGADVAANPLQKTNEPILLNDTPTKQAAIVLRYRLYSYHPDEMITFR